MLSPIVSGFALTIATVAAAKPHAVIDKRNKSDASGVEYSVSLCSRPSPGPGGLPGHAFVSYAKKPAEGHRSVVSVGYTTTAGPLEGVLSFSSILAKPAGFLGEERFSSVQENCLVVLVNEETFLKAWKVAKPFANVPELAAVQYAGIYSLTNKDCQTFAIAVAKSLEVRVPKRGTLDTPAQYIRKLIEAN